MVYKALDCDVSEVITKASSIVHVKMNVLHGFISFHHPRTHRHQTSALHLGLPLLVLRMGIGPVSTLSNLFTVYPANYVLSPMAPVVRIEPNGV